MTPDAAPTRPSRRLTPDAAVCALPRSRAHRLLPPQRAASPHVRRDLSSSNGPG